MWTWAALLLVADPGWVDAHVHIAPSELDRAVRLFDRVGVDWALNLSGGWPGGVFERQWTAARESGRVVLAANLPWRAARHPRFPEAAVALLEAAAAQGARALKIEKALGLGVVGPSGARWPVDAPALDPVWRAAGRLGLPVVIHTGDPKAFFEPPGPENERWEELAAHPSWSYHGDPEIPSFAELLGEHERLIARHPETVFVSVHFGNHAEDPWAVAEWLDRYPNLYVDLAARIVELGRHDPSRLGALFRRHAGRIVFGTDLGLWPGGIMLGSTGATPDTDEDAPAYYEAHDRWLTTADVLPSPVPIQGRWDIFGLALPPEVLTRIVRTNAEMLFGPPPAGAKAAREHPPFFRDPE